MIKSAQACLLSLFVISTAAAQAPPSQTSTPEQNHAQGVKVGPTGSVQVVTIQPVAIQPVAIQPVAIQPVAIQPVAIQPVAIQPVSNCHIGRLSTNESFSPTAPNNYCVEGKYYVGAPYRIGRINVFTTEADSTSHPTGYVMVSATQHDHLFKRLNQKEACPEREIPVVQFRSDWYADEGGYENTRQQLSEAKFLEMTGVITPLSFMQIDDPRPAHKQRRRRRPTAGAIENVTIRLTNPLSVPLDGLTLVLHYEGGAGKPMPHYVTIPLSLKPGETANQDVPVYIIKDYKNGRSSSWGFRNATLEGEAGGCTFWPSTYRRYNNK